LILLISCFKVSMVMLYIRKTISFLIFSQGRKHTIEQINGILFITIRIFLSYDEVAHLALSARLLRAHILEESILENGLRFLLLLLELEVLVKHYLYHWPLTTFLCMFGTLALMR